MLRTHYRMAAGIMDPAHHPNPEPERSARGARQAVVTLRTQYRMAQGIMDLANHLVYNGRLRCGSADVAAARLDLELDAGALAGMPAWLQRVRAGPGRMPACPACARCGSGRCRAPNGRTRVRSRFRGSRRPCRRRPRAAAAGRRAHCAHARGERRRWRRRRACCSWTCRGPARLCNPAEAGVVCQLVAALQSGGVPLDAVGVISPYRSQARRPAGGRARTCAWPVRACGARVCAARPLAPGAGGGFSRHRAGAGCYTPPDRAAARARRSRCCSARPRRAAGAVWRC